MSEKRFQLSTDEIRPIVTNRGSCLATDRVTVHGAPIGIMYREAVDDPTDSGWRFVAGSEPDAYCAEAGNWGVYDLNALANVDGGIVRFLDQPAGSVYERDSSGKLVRWSSCKVPEKKVFTIPDAEGESVLDANWVADIPVRFQRRIEEANIIFWRPGFTIWMQAFGTRGDSSAKVRAKMEESLPKSASDVVREEAGGLWRILFRIPPPSADFQRPALVALVWVNGQLLNLTCCFDDEADAAKALAIARSARARS